MNYSLIGTKFNNYINFILSVLFCSLFNQCSLFCTEQTSNEEDPYSPENCIDMFCKYQLCEPCIKNLKVNDNPKINMFHIESLLPLISYPRLCSKCSKLVDVLLLASSIYEDTRPIASPISMKIAISMKTSTDPANVIGEVSTPILDGSYDALDDNCPSLSKNIYIFDVPQLPIDKEDILQLVSGNGNHEDIVITSIWILKHSKSGHIKMLICGHNNGDKLTRDKEGDFLNSGIQWNMLVFDNKDLPWNMLVFDNKDLPSIDVDFDIDNKKVLFTFNIFINTDPSTCNVMVHNPDRSEVCTSEDDQSCPPDEKNVPSNTKRPKKRAKTSSSDDCTVSTSPTQEEDTSTTPSSSSAPEEDTSTTPSSSSAQEEDTSTTPSSSSAQEEDTSTTPSSSSAQEEDTSTTPSSPSTQKGNAPSTSCTII